MNLSLQPTWEIVLVFGALATLVGLGGIVIGPSKRSRLPRGVLVVGVLLVLAEAGCMAELGAPQFYWFAVFALLAVSGFFRLLAYPPVRAVALLLLGPGLIFWQAYAVPPASPTFNADDWLGPAVPDVQMSDEPVAWAVTDAGNPVPLHTAAPAEGEVVFNAAKETLFLQHRDLLQSVIRTGDANLKSNCHGWVFTGGRYWVKAREVDRILKENGYATVSAPRAGDVAVYREENGRAYHTAVVRCVTEDGTIFQESKWGTLGRFLHTADKNPYAYLLCTYHRSSRDGHCLKGL
jgi:hypothetical protein